MTPPPSAKKAKGTPKSAGKKKAAAAGSDGKEPAVKQKKEKTPVK